MKTRRPLYLVLIQVLPFVGFAGNAKPTVDSSHIEAKLVHHQEQIGLAISDINAKAFQTIDSLKEELRFQRAKEDYFSVALEDQSNRFGTIVVIALGLTALFSYSGFRAEVKKIQTESDLRLRKHKKQTKKLKRNGLKLKRSSHHATSNLFSSIARSSFHEENYVSAFQFYLHAARYTYLANRITAKTKDISEAVFANNKQVCISHISRAQRSLLKVENKIEFSKAENSILKKSLKILGTHDDEKIVEQVAAIRLRLTEIKD